MSKDFLEYKAFVELFDLHYRESRGIRVWLREG